MFSFAGKSRSTSFVLAYLMMDKGMNLKDALDHVRDRRTIAEPNCGFMFQLKAFERVIFGTISDTNVPLSKREESKSETLTDEQVANSLSKEESH